MYCSWVVGQVHVYWVLVGIVFRVHALLPMVVSGSGCIAIQSAQLRLLTVLNVACPSEFRYFGEDPGAWATSIEYTEHYFDFVGHPPATGRQYAMRKLPLKILNFISSIITLTLTHTGIITPMITMMSMITTVVVWLPPDGVKSRTCLQPSSGPTSRGAQTEWDVYQDPPITLYNRGYVGLCLV